MTKEYDYSDPTQLEAYVRTRVALDENTTGRPWAEFGVVHHPSGELERLYINFTADCPEWIIDLT